jgi:hypothetical protein
MAVAAETIGGMLNQSGCVQWRREFRRWSLRFWLFFLMGLQPVCKGRAMYFAAHHCRHAVFAIISGSNNSGLGFKKPRPNKDIINLRSERDGAKGDVPVYGA